MPGHGAMAGTMDRQIAQQEEHERRLAAQQLAAFREEHAGKFVETFLGLTEKKRIEKVTRQTTAIDGLCTGLWEQLRSGCNARRLKMSVPVSVADSEYYNAYGRRAVCDGLDINGAALAEQGIELKVEVVEDNRGPGSSGMTFLKAEFGHRAV